MLATYVDPHRRAVIKSVLIDGEATAEILARTRGRAKTGGNDQ